jgi:hypothetical protein
MFTMMSRMHARLLSVPVSRLLASAGAAVACSAAAAGTKVWDSRDLWATSSIESDSDAGERLSAAFAQFADWPVYTEVAAVAGIAIGLSALLAFHPRAGYGAGAVSALEERKTQVLLGLVAAAAGMLAASTPVVALILVAVAVLLRGRAIGETPGLDVSGTPVAGMQLRAVMIAVVGLAVGIGQFLPALLLTGAAWAILWWLGAHRFARIKVRMAFNADRERAKTLIVETLARLNCRSVGVKESGSGRAYTFTVRVPASVNDELLTRGLSAALAPEIGAVEVEMRAE